MMIPATDQPTPKVAKQDGLHIESLVCGYGRQQVLNGVSIDVNAGEVVALLGHNGAGKTSLLRAVMGMIPVRSGAIEIFGRSLTRLPTAERVRAGLAYSPSEAGVFAQLSVNDNLGLGAYTASDRVENRNRLGHILSLFPVLADRPRAVGGTLSGGQQRMLSIGIALMSNPRILLLDEPSLGLAPVVVQAVLSLVKNLTETDALGVLLVEQNVRAALAIADRAVFLRQGSIVLAESATAALARGTWWDLF